ncbi:MAG TPA: AAA family ATPase [Lysobacter sp.]
MIGQKQTPMTHRFRSASPLQSPNAFCESRITNHQSRPPTTMRIKRFIAPDMRTALRMVRDEQGPDAVILSNRPTEDGIEIVAATDYDESLAQQALRAALPALAPAPVPVASPTTPATVAMGAIGRSASSNELPPPLLAGEGRRGVATPRSGELGAVAPRTPLPASPSWEEEEPNSRLGSLATLLGKSRTKSSATAPVAESTHAATTAASSAASRTRVAESPIRGRAVFAIGDAPANAPAMPVARAPKAETRIAATQTPPDTSRFDAMMAALIPADGSFDVDDDVVVSLSTQATTEAVIPPSPTGRGIEGEGQVLANVADHSDAAHPSAPSAIERVHSADPAGRGAQSAGAIPAERPLHAVPDARDPGILAMREELATMRQMIERELGQFTVERLRGSPARAAAFDALLGYGCDESLAQTVAGRIDATLDPSQVREPMLAELARMLSVIRHEPLDDGGVIALVGPTGAGKTTTAAKLAARFAQRHRARDVALVTTDTERPGATEQLHILGRRLGVTVCEANGPEALNEALDQLADYPLVLVDTAGHGLRDRALLGQILWLRAARRVRSLLVLPANSNAHDLGEVVRRYRPASPEGVVLTKLDETGRLGTSLSVLVQHGLGLAYTTDGQQVPHDLAAADATRLVATLEKVRRAADNPLGSLDSRVMTLPTEDRHAIAS